MNYKLYRIGEARVCLWNFVSEEDTKTFDSIMQEVTNLWNLYKPISTKTYKLLDKRRYIPLEP